MRGWASARGVATTRIRVDTQRWLRAGSLGSLVVLVLLFNAVWPPKWRTKKMERLDAVVASPALPVVSPAESLVPD